jgi:hypothetical protein
MLHEARKTPVHGDYDRQWIVDDYFDLIVWYTTSNAVHGFQLSYDKPDWERALTWLSDKGFFHTKVDSGDQTPLANRTPVLVPDGLFPAERVLAEFQRRGRALPPDLRELVVQKIDEYVRTRKVEPADEATAPDAMIAITFATTPCVGLSLSR